MAGWEKLLKAGDAATDLTGTAYRMLLVDSAGDVIELAHGAANKVLTSQGASADPTWEDAPGPATLDAIGDVAAITEARGQIIFRDATSWNALDPGTTDYFLQTKGAGADPVWTAAAALSDTAPNTIEPDDSASAGVAGTASRYDHEHAIVCAAAGNISVDATAAEGSATSFARSDHVHGMTCATPTSVGTSCAEGSGTDFVRSDHVHDLGADCIDSGDLIADDVVDSEHIAADAIQAEHIDDTATDIAFNQLILTPKSTGTGTTEGTLFYDSDDDHLYVYVV